MQTHTKALLLIGVVVIAGFFARHAVANAFIDAVVYCKEKTRRAVVHRYPHYTYNNQTYYLVNPLSTPEYADNVLNTSGTIVSCIVQHNGSHNLTELLKQFAGPCGDFHVGYNDAQPTVYDLLLQEGIIGERTPTDLSVNIEMMMLTDTLNTLTHEVTMLTTLASLTV